MSPKLSRPLRSLYRTTLFASLLILSALLPVTVPSRAAATTSVPVERLRSQLQGRTQVPIVIPATLPTEESLFSSATVTSDRYEISFTYTPDCQGTACTWGSFSAERSEYLEDDPGLVEAVTLVDGTQAWFNNFCGAYCNARVFWFADGSLYSAWIKNGTREAAIALANAAVQKTGSSSSVFVPGQSTAVLNPRNSSSPVRIRSVPSSASDASVIGTGFFGDRGTVLERAEGTDGLLWYEINFHSLGIVGWVREDLVLLQP